MQRPDRPSYLSWVALASWRRERRELQVLGLLAVLIPSCWIIVLGWSPATLVSGHDAILQVITPLRDLAASGAAGLRYRPDLMGGVKMADVFGNLTLPYFRVSLAFGLSPLTAYNSFVFLCQLAIAFVGLGAVRGLVKAWSGTEARLSWFDCAGTGVVLAFAPVLAWRICYGHVNLLLGAMAYYFAFCAVVLAVTRTLTISLTVALLLGLWHALLSTGQQIILYGAVFGGPLLAVLFMHLSAAQLADRLRASLQLAGIAALPFLAAMPGIELMMQHAGSSDAARGLHTESMIYGFAVSTWRDWIASIPWAKDLVQAGRADQLQHELNYALGPLLVGLAMMPWRAVKTVGVALAVCGLAALLFSMNIAPVATALPELVGVLHAFRVPARAFLPFAVVIPVLAIAALLFRLRRNEASSVEDAPLPALLAGLVAVLLALGFLPNGAREAMVWLLMLVAVVFAASRTLGKWLTCTVILIPLAGASLAAFKERSLRFVPQDALVATAERLGTSLKMTEPRLGSALTRVQLDIDVAGMWLNTGYAMKVSTLDGYWAPSRRMLLLYFALQDKKYDPALVALSVRPGDKAFAPFRQLYNLCCEATLSNGIPTVRSLGRTAGEAWIPRRIERVRDTNALATAFRDAGDTLAGRLRDTLWLVESDTHAAQVISKLDAGELRCGNAQINRIDARHWGGRIAIELAASAACPIVVATNYAETLWARDQDGRRLVTFPADGPLLGILADSDSKQIVIDAR